MDKLWASVGISYEGASIYEYVCGISMSDAELPVKPYKMWEGGSFWSYSLFTW